MGGAHSDLHGSLFADDLSGQSPVVTLQSTASWRAHLDASKGSTRLMVVEFTSSWCGPCKSMEPAINELAIKFTDVWFVKIDVEKLSAVAKEWGAQSLPAFVLVKRGEEVDKVVGVKKDELQKKIEKHRI
eukprot:TRINITY_DN2128_c0_g1_i1.p1 TRINITY_DN2128_c0_g1~~TRINITY_DN2128_c0_g1_i1.p1  ORF type:complete len:130 (-),score=26.52 TRINITY_DN2128_c0_g1_i1:454-843(-)